MLKRALVAVVAVPLVALSLACGASTGGSSTSAGAGGGDGGAQEAARTVTTVKAGEALNLVEDFLGSKTRVTITLSNVKFDAKAGKYDKPEQGQFITADVAVLVAEGKFSISGGSFKLVAADGTAYNTTYLSGLRDLSGQDLTPGQKTSGQIAFDAAKGAQTGGRIALTNMMAEGDAGYWTL